MTSYEIVKRAVEFKRPERIPIRCPEFGFDDVHFVAVAAAAGFQPAAAGWKPQDPNADEWGCIWRYPPEESGIVNMGQCVGHPLSSLDRMDEIDWPDPTDDSRYAGIEAALSEAGSKYIQSGWGLTFFERMHFLRGMPELLIDMHESPRQVHELAERVLDFPLQVARELGRRFGGRIHGFSMTDDWGTQLGPFISLPMWREFFKERYRRLFSAIHQAGMHAWLHSCGHVNDIIGEWTDCGLDVVNLMQPRNLGIEEIGQRYRGSICFETTCDIQVTLPFRTEEEIREESGMLLRHWGTPEGGFILADIGDGKDTGVSAQRKRAMVEEFVRLAAPGIQLGGS